MARLTKEEKEILEAYESGELRPVRGGGKPAARYREYAQETLRKDRRVNIRLSSRDVEAIQKRAIQEGIPYQTLMASILHKYAEGRLVEREN
jgi:predicted DNA binding CopG/RHH family protein